MDDLGGGEAEVVCVVDIRDLEAWLDCFVRRVIEKPGHPLEDILLFSNSGCAAGDWPSRPIDYVIPDRLGRDISAVEEGDEGADGVVVQG